jgi:hypothetical protein
MTARIPGIRAKSGAQIRAPYRQLEYQTRIRTRIMIKSDHETDLDSGPESPIIKVDFGS